MSVEGRGHMRRLLPAVILVLVAGCTGVGMQGSPAWLATASPETQAEYFRKRCVSYGFRPGTVEMAQCIQTESQGARNRAQRQVAIAQASGPVTTNCNRIGSNVSCTSY